MPHRDPDTGKFVSNQELDQYDDVFPVRNNVNFSVPAADVGGQTGQSLGQEGQFDGVEIIDYGDHLDRDHVAAVLWHHFHVTVYIASTQTADGTLRVNIECSFQPSSTIAGVVGGTFTDVADASGDFTVEQQGSGGGSDSEDLIGPALLAVAHGPITDGTNGVGGAGTSDTRTWEGPPVTPTIVDLRDQLFLNGGMEHSNVSDASLHADVQLWQVLGAMEV